MLSKKIFFIYVILTIFCQICGMQQNAAASASAAAAPQPRSCWKLLCRCWCRKRAYVQPTIESVPVQESVPAVALPEELEFVPPVADVEVHGGVAGVGALDSEITQSQPRPKSLDDEIEQLNKEVHSFSGVLNAGQWRRLFKVKIRLAGLSYWISMRRDVILRTTRLDEKSKKRLSDEYIDMEDALNDIGQYIDQLYKAGFPKIYDAKSKGVSCCPFHRTFVLFKPNEIY